MRALRGLALWGLMGLHGLALGQARERVVLYGDDNYPPYAYVERGEYRGIYVDLLREAAQALPDYEVVLEPVPWKRALLLMETGAGFAIFPPYRRAERDAAIGHYSRPLMRERVVLMCRRGRVAHDAQFPADFSRLLIGTNAGFLVFNGWDVSTLRIDAAGGNASNVRKLARGHIDCYGNDALSIQYTLAQLRAQAPRDKELLGLELDEVLELSGEDAFVGYSRRASPPYKARFIADLDAALKALATPSLLRRLMQKYVNPPAAH